MRNPSSVWVERSRAIRAVALAVGASLVLAIGSAGAQLRLPTIAPLGNDGPLTYFIGEPVAENGARSGDPELCTWALEDWIRHADARLSAQPAGEEEALIRVYFVEPGAGQYGEMRPMLVNGRRGAAVFVRPDTDAQGPDIALAARADPLLRDTIVYLTCLHELGHALGMVHTDEFADVMYFFGYGGDIPAFFGRYRERLQSRDSIPMQSGLSAGDIAQLLAAYPDEGDGGALNASSNR
jgi:hypothetical protein